MFQPNLFSNLRGLALAFALGVLTLSGCKDNPGKWPPDQVATKVSDSLEISGLVLTATGSGLEGKGNRADGEILTVVVKQNAEEGKISWDAKGDRGFVESGSYYLTK